MDVRSLAIVSAAAAGVEEGDGCKALKKAVSAPPKPGFLAGINIPMPNLGLDLTKPVEFPEDTSLGDCAGRLVANAAGPALVYGKADPGRSAELRFLALDLHNLVIQVRDSRPDKAKPASWVGADHLEIIESRQAEADERVDDRPRLIAFGRGRVDEPGARREI